MSYAPKNFNVWAEIPVRDLDKAMTFYAAATGGALDKVEMGGETVAFFRTEEPGKGVSANLYVGEPGKPDRGVAFYLLIDGGLEAAMARTEAAGGTLLGEVVTIPPGRYVYAADPDGNRVGLFEAAA
ncbi:VOC family protein [Tropicimonas marinistellae]|uniref:VOC family protein n=1 Tax=Tropicimonas marinistellae TaxID=1739787 RepID=UPI00082E1397|nr:VOC family protein [Tropicimonas marinistellae]